MFKKIRKGALLSLVMAALCLVAGSPAAADAKDLVLKGDAKCTACHDEADAPELLGIGRTKHGTRADGRTPTCTSCHGESKGHAESKGSQPKPDVIFGRKGPTPASAQNEACLGCHQKDSRRHLWAGSVHDARDVACASCHNIHSGVDKVRDKAAQPEVCYTCHAGQRVKANKPSHHPVVEGQMTCSDCHNAHGSAGPALMKRDSVVETCYTCHMEKRGPFVRNHQPVGENCATCHDVHGTTAGNLLKFRQPFLCQTCHTPHGPTTPAVAKGGNAQPGWWNGSTITQGRGCTNCHTEIHGSNNPSLLSPTPQRLFR
ncbi:MAG: DmsE family decaheme c-type cytochrome [Betaproteobacteria bacterium]|nr:DmsE family decaheme c-type cytochrome [Betaproteobacteria bacterium]